MSQQKRQEPQGLTRHQRWAQGAFRRVTDKKKARDEAKYKTLCMTTPALLQKSGLAQGLAFLWARDQDLGKGFLCDLAEVYGLNPTRGGAHAAGRALLETAQRKRLAGYMAMTADLIDVAIWFRRFAQAELAGDPANEEV